MAATEKKILVVDGEEIVREVIVAVLESRGHRVDEAADGPAALERVERTSYDLVIIDTAAPGFDGLLKTLLEMRPAIRRGCLFITDAGSEEAGTLAGAFGGREFMLNKPFGKDELLERVNGILKPVSNPA